MRFWRTTSNFEVDLIVGDMDLAIEFKGTDSLRSDDPKGLRALAEEHRPRRSLIVSLEKKNRKLPDGIELMHFEQFLKELWSGRLIRFK